MAANASGVYICFSLSCAETKYPAAGAVIGVYTLAASAASRRAVRSAMRALKSDTTPIVSCILFCASWMEARASDSPV